MKQIKEHRRWWDIKTPVWMSIAFIIFCIAMAVIAGITVTSNPEAHIEYKTSHLSYDPDWEKPEEGTKKVYWRVEQSEVPQWKRLTNRWHKLKHAGKEYIWSHFMTLVDEFTVQEFQEVKESCLTVGDIKEYKKQQKEIYNTGSRRGVKKSLRKQAKQMWDDIE